MFANPSWPMYRRMVKDNLAHLYKQVKRLENVDIDYCCMLNYEENNYVQSAHGQLINPRIVAAVIIECRSMS